MPAGCIQGIPHILFSRHILQQININILLHTTIALILKLSLLGLLQNHYIFKRTLLKVNFDP